MCTLSWKPADGGYALWFNRDERRDRPPAAAPALQWVQGVPCIAPRDAAGGTWLLVNRYGLALGLLNHYPSTPLRPLPCPPSRGLLPLACADCAEVAVALGRCALQPLGAYPPFRLVAANARGAAVLTWDGHASSLDWLDPAGAMLTSSSYRPETTERARRSLFERLVGPMERATAPRLAAYHHYRGGDPAIGVRMARADACTHSIACIAVSEREGEAHFHYEPQPEIAPAAPDLTRRLTLTEGYP